MITRRMNADFVPDHGIGVRLAGNESLRMFPGFNHSDAADDIYWKPREENNLQ